MPAAAIVRPPRNGPIWRLSVGSDDGILVAVVAAIEQRVAFVEGRVVELGRAMTDVRDAISTLERRMDERFAGVDRRFEGIERRLDAIDHRIANQFLWVVGLQVTTIAAVFTAIFAR